MFSISMFSVIGMHLFGRPVSKTDDLCIKNEKFCIKNEELCIKNEEFCILNDEFCRSMLNPMLTDVLSQLDGDENGGGELQYKCQFFWGGMFY